MAASFGVPEPDTPGSERVAVVIQLHDGYPEEVSPEDIRSHCQKHLPPYAIPKYIEFRDKLPMTVTEKLFKKELREQMIEKMK
jgi:acyl-CoA synthetase (AMP-forming)/AMP-acid ligase II